MSGSIQVCRYSQSNQAEWDAFVAASKNATFLFCRDYMDYHHDRFQDCSLMLRDEKNVLLAILPAVPTGTLSTVMAD